MSDWDEKAEDYAQAHHVYEHRDVATNYHGFRMVVAGARWQREALLSEEAVERAARELCASAGENPDSNELWDEEPPWMDYTDEARAALAAALGEDER